MLTSSVEIGGALVNTTEVENFPGFPDGIMGPDLMDNMRKQAERFGARLIYDDATALELTGDVKTITTGSGEVYQAHAVVLAMGSAYRKLNVAGEALRSFLPHSRVARARAYSSYMRRPALR